MPQADLPPQPSNGPAQYELSTPSSSIEAGRQAIVDEINRKWPGKRYSVVSESMVEGKLVTVVSIDADNPSHPESSEGSASPEDDDIKMPSIVIFLSGNNQQFGDMPDKPATPGKPVIVATKGDSEDHRLMDSKWSSAMAGTGKIWDGTLGWKYRTNTVALFNKETRKLIIEQGGVSAECDEADASETSDIRSMVQQCLE